MHVNFGPRGMLQIDDARIVHRNFSGTATKYNAAGNRNFSVVIEDEEVKDALIEAGWNVKIKPPREDGEPAFMFLPVKVKYPDGRDDRQAPPKVYLNSNGRKTELDEESIECLDNIDIMSVDLDIRPYNWDVNGKTGTTAYLKSIHVTQEVDRFAERYTD